MKYAAPFSRSREFSESNLNPSSYDSANSGSNGGGAGSGGKMRCVNPPLLKPSYHVREDGRGDAVPTQPASVVRR